MFLLLSPDSFLQPGIQNVSLSLRVQLPTRATISAAWTQRLFGRRPPGVLTPVAATYA